MSSGEETIAFLKAKCPYVEFPLISITLGSGLGYFAEDALLKERIIPYGEIPGFAQSTVSGHKGNLIFGTVNKIPVVCLQGRFHFYEGYSMERLVFPLRCLSELGVKGVFLSNAAGGINANFVPGTLMAIEDHINFIGTNPLIGLNHDHLGPRFPDMSEAWDRPLRTMLKSVAKNENIDLATGIYLAVTGPSFETPAEIRAFATIGADAVGMSTVPECIAAVHAGMRVVGVSCITNAAAGLSNKPLTHEEVGETAKSVEKTFSRLLEVFIPEMYQLIR